MCKESFTALVACPVSLMALNDLTTQVPTKKATSQWCNISLNKERNDGFRK